MNSQISSLSERATAGSSLFSTSAISSHLLELGYPQIALSSMAKCGTLTGYSILADCSCGTREIPLTHHCNHRECSECAKIRKRRIRSRFLPLLSKMPNNRGSDCFYFLTISPKNYDTCEQGQKEIKQGFSRLIRTNYVKNRVKGGISIVETTENGKGFHVHSHSIIYGRELDNRIRGKCLDCNQSLIKFDYNSKKYYCANRKCNSLNVLHKKNSKIVSLAKKSFGRDVNVHISALPTLEYTLNYLLKYVSVNGDGFSSEKTMAEYIYYTYNKRLINTFGVFFRMKFIKPVCRCSKCFEIISFISDNEIVELFKQKKSLPEPAKNWFQTKDATDGSGLV